MLTTSFLALRDIVLDKERESYDWNEFFGERNNY